MSGTGSFMIGWHDHGREPQCKPNPAYPNGVDLDCSEGAKMKCVAKLPYPARRCGIYFVKCNICNTTVAATTAGRRDDPRSITIGCNLTSTDKSVDVAVKEKTPA